MKTYTVAIYDSTANTIGRDSGYYGKGDYSWASNSLNGGACDIPTMTKEEAEQWAKDCEEYIDKNNLSWASVCVEEYDIPEEDD